MLYRENRNVTSVTYNLNTSNEMSCYYNSSIYRFHTTILPYLVPARIEAALLGTSFLFSMWPSVRNSAVFSLESSAVHQFEISEERQPLLSRNAHAQPNSRRRHPASFFAAMFFGTTINIIMVVSTLVFMFALRDQKEKRHEMYPAWLIILITYKFIMFIMVGIVFRMYGKYGNMSDADTKLTATEYILIFASAGAAGQLYIQLHWKPGHHPN